MEFDNFIGRQKHFLSKEECEIVIDAMYNNELCSGYLTVHDNERSDTNAFLDSNTELFKTLNIKLFDSLASYTKKYDLPVLNCYKNNFIKIQVSEDGGGFCKWHYEWSTTYLRREIVWMIYLNDDFEGGHTEFKHINHSETPETGKLLLFPAGYTHYHRASPELKGQKYITTGWFNR